MPYGIGVDSGDTFTDAVLLDLEKKKILATKKVPTTHNDLSEGIFSAIDGVTEDIDPSKITQVSVSSTLATNSIVEGRGGYVGLLALGWKPDEAQEFPRSKRAYIPGRFNPRGTELQPLGEERVRSLVDSWGPEVEGFAIAGYFSVRNPEHENRTREIIEEKTDKPVVSSHELSPKLGFYERAVTAVLNVKVIPIITSFVDSARSALEKRGITAPIMVVKSDGSLASVSEINRKPIETIFSGPAASAIGARWLSGKETGVVVDIGGTTVDIATLKDGLPDLSEEGARVGKWQTKVKSMDLRSVGLGGDSRIELDEEGNVEIGPNTARPLAFGDVTEGNLAEMEERGDTTFVKRQESPATVDGGETGLGESFRGFYELTGEELKNETGLLDRARQEKLLRGPTYLRELENLGFLSRVGMTPTDLLHVLGDYLAGNTEVPHKAAEVLADQIGEEPVKFAQSVKGKFEREIAQEVVKKYVLSENSAITFDDNSLWNFCRDNRSPDIDVDFSLNIPLIGIGAPAASFLPQVADRLGTDFVEVENYEVGNAVGAIAGKIVRRFSILVLEEVERDQFILFLPDDRVVIQPEDELEAMDRAEEIGREEGKRRALEAGGTEVSLTVEREEFNHGRGRINVTAKAEP